MLQLHRSLSFLSFNWGCIGDLDVDSEKLRWLGAIRLDLWGAYMGTIRKPVYPGIFEYTDLDPARDAAEFRVNPLDDAGVTDTAAEVTSSPA